MDKYYTYIEQNYELKSETANFHKWLESHLVVDLQVWDTKQKFSAWSLNQQQIQPSIYVGV